MKKEISEFTIKIIKDMKIRTYKKLSDNINIVGKHYGADAIQDNVRLMSKKANRIKKLSK